MNREDIAYMPAFELAEKLQTQTLTSEEVTEIMIERIERLNPIVNAYCTPTFNKAREMAAKADKKIRDGNDHGLLTGIPLSVKDLNWTKGIRTTFGSKLYENFIPDQDDIVVKRLKDAGCVLLGKTNTPEFGFKGVTDNLVFGTTKNPWNLERTSGGSSGGAAVSVATGMAFLAQGSDGGGSIRIPSSLCGLYGLKPTFGRTPNYPSEMIFGETLGVNGPIVRYVKDAALMLQVMKGLFLGDRHSIPDDNINYLEVIDNPPNKLKIGYTLDLGYAKVIDFQVEENILNSLDVFRNYGWEVEKVKMKLRNPELPFYTIWMAKLSFELASKLDEWEDKMDPDIVKLIKGALGYDLFSLVRAQKTRKEIYETFYKIFKDIDILISPTTAVPAFETGIMYPPKINDKKVSPTAWQAFTFPFNLTEQPAASIPCGWTKEGLPIGMQIIGRKFDERTILQVSKVFEDKKPWQSKRPILN
ncbi:MAG: amidase [Promethearchaeota archaeon]|nr:MAG: amidase [Candidatus Lokiarchaeota archaeon]